MHHPLNNPVWHALTGPQAHLALRSANAARYRPGMSTAVGLAEFSPAAFGDLKSLFEVGDVAALAILPDVIDGADWEVVWSFMAPQYLLHKPVDPPDLEPFQLTQADVPEMLELVALTRPGPFFENTIEMGNYFGLREGGKLIAMAGERVHLDGYCEISAVCTHPEARGRNLGGDMTLFVAHQIQARGEVPFLHSNPKNRHAIRLYEKLGFEKRTDRPLTMLRRVR